MQDKGLYMRILELQAVITEEWGEAVKELNNYIWKGEKPEDLEKAHKELNDMVSPLMELSQLIERIVRKNK